MGRLGAVVSANVARHGGVRRAGAGERGSLVAAFARASEALGCALGTQRELEGQGLPLLRVGLHTGEAQLGGEARNFGQAVGRAARLRDLGHAGQVLLSRVCADLVADHLPPGPAWPTWAPTACVTSPAPSRSTSWPTPTCRPDSLLCGPWTATPTTWPCS